MILTFMDLIDKLINKSLSLAEGSASLDPEIMQSNKYYSIHTSHHIISYRMISYRVVSSAKDSAKAANSQIITAASTERPIHS